VANALYYAGMNANLGSVGAAILVWLEFADLSYQLLYIFYELPVNGGIGWK
jgi:hypothetical protein